MEFRCRLGTPGGEIIEGVYVAEDEARLRREFEEKGLYVLRLQRAGRLAFGTMSLPQRRRISTREFLEAKPTRQSRSNEPQHDHHENQHEPMPTESGVDRFFSNSFSVMT